MQKTILVAGQTNLAISTGGAITVYRNFIEMLARNGYHVIATWDSPESAKPAWEIPGVVLVNTYYKYPGISQYRDTFNHLVKDSSPDLIVFFFPAEYLGAHLKREFRHIPRILMFHSRPDFYFAVYHGLKRRLRKYYINTHTQILMESFRSMLPWYIRKGAVHVIPNSVPLPEEQTVHIQEQKKIVFFSRLDSLKGADLAIDAMALVARRYPDWHLDMYGDFDPAAYRDTLQTQIDHLGLNGQVCLQGLSAQSAAQTLLHYDFCLFPSRFEGFSIGLAESMASGLACIGLNNASGVNEMIIDGYNGLLTMDNAEDLAGGILRLIENPYERERMGTNARIYMRQFSPESIQSRWLSLIASILSPTQKYRVKPVKELVKLMRLMPAVNPTTHREQLIVSLTTWKARIQNIPAVLDSIFAQTLPPDRVVLNLAFDEEIPDNVQAYLSAHQVEVNRVPDTKVYKKLIPTLKKYPDACVVPIDDDWLYPPEMLEEFMRIHRQHPDHPISGNKVTSFHLASHCGCASLTKSTFFGKYLGWIDDAVILNCPSDDIVYTYFTVKNGYSYIRTDNQYFENMTPYHAQTPYSSSLSNINPVQISWDYLTQRFGSVYDKSLRRLLHVFPSWLFELQRDGYGKKYLRLFGKKFYDFPRILRKR